MISHAASMASLFVDQLAQAQSAIPCVQVTPEPTLKSLLPTIVQTVVSLASISAGVLIAVWSFRKNRQTEHVQWVRNQQAGHEQWIRDQSKAEWKELLVKIAEIEHEIPIIITGLPDHYKLEPIVLSILPPLRGTLFVYSSLESSGFIAKWELFVQYVSGRFMMTTHTNRSVQTGTLGEPVSLEVIESWDDKSTKEEIEIRNRLHALLGELRELAHKSLEMKVGQL